MLLEETDAADRYIKIYLKSIGTQTCGCLDRVILASSARLRACGII
jgi:hypothetical protein